MQMPDFQLLTVEFDERVLTVTLNRPDKLNALNEPLWREFREVFEWADQQNEIRAVILAGNGKHFCAGIDLEMLQGMHKESDDPARNAESMRRHILWLQECFTVIEQCRVPVIAAIHAGCIGGGVDMVTAADLRFATEDAIFCVKEVDVGLVADVGTLQRLPRLIPEGVAREWAMTARNVPAEEALRYGLVSRLFPDKESLMAGVREVAVGLANKSPIAMRATKAVMNYSREHSIEEGLNFVATWNAGIMSRQDIIESVTATMEKRAPQFED